MILHYQKSNAKDKVLLEEMKKSHRVHCSNKEMSRGDPKYSKCSGYPELTETWNIS